VKRSRLRPTPCLDTPQLSGDDGAPRVAEGSGRGLFRGSCRSRGGRALGRTRRRTRLTKLAVVTSSLVFLCGSARTSRVAPLVTRAHTVQAVTPATPGHQLTAITIPAPSTELPPDQLHALVFLCHLGSSTSTRFDTGVREVFGPVTEIALSPAQQDRFDRQWREAVSVARSLATPERAAAAGYVQASLFLRGVGTHWIKWSLVGRPFNVTKPSMLLFDWRVGHPQQLVGFSYWVASNEAPAGFEGRNDRWHRHSGLCFTSTGWLSSEDVSNLGCKGHWLDGQDLWMLHAWVVPGFPNLWGQFAPINPMLCPTAGPDILLCKSSP
jgi:hypothetical protein